MHKRLAFFLIFTLLLASTGCQFFPDVSHQPVIHNPFPQLSKVAVAPFFNHSDEATVDGRQFALAYYAALQAVPGFEVVPLSIVETAMQENRISLSSPQEARRLAQILGVDAVVVGAVTDFTPYYPPRCGLHVEWYAANPGFHSIPAGYGLPWGTAEEEFIPAPLVFEAEMALAKAQLKTQTPNCSTQAEPLLPDARPIAPDMLPPGRQKRAPQNSGQGGIPYRLPEQNSANTPPVASKSQTQSITNGEDPFEKDDQAKAMLATHTRIIPIASTTAKNNFPANEQGVIAQSQEALPPNWPDARGFIPPGPSPFPAPCVPNNGPVMTHTQIYHGSDAGFTEALASYYHFQDDARFGGWQSHLQRSDDFIRFCCHLHVSELLSARGGAGETRVVWRWSDSR